MKNIVTIGAGAFANTALTSVDLPQAATIGAGAFEGSALERARLSARA